jgi:hypothetical protein
VTPAAGAVAVLVALGGVPAAPAVGGWVPGEHGGPTVRITVQNWGEDTDIAEPGHAAWAHDSGLTRLTVTIDPGAQGMHGYYGRLRAPDASGGELVLYCGDEYHRIESPVVCGFDVPMSSGVNRIVFDLQSASFEGIRTTVGGVIGGDLDAVPVLELRAPDGRWQAIPRGGLLGFAGAPAGTLRYRIMNTGDIPFRVPGSCQGEGTVWPYQQLLCPVREYRPYAGMAVGLAGPVVVPLDVRDPAGGTMTLVLAGRVAAPVEGSDARPRGTHA